MNEYKISPNINNSTFNGVKKSFSDNEIIQLMKKYHFSEENFAVMSGDIEKMKQINPRLLEYNYGEKIRSDTRNPIEYKMGLCASWILENYNMDRCNDVFKDLGTNAKIKLNGGDKDRIIICNNGEVTAEADFLINWENVEISLEHCISYTGFFIREEQISLRNKKYYHLKENNSLIMAVETFGYRDKDKWKYALIGGVDFQNFVQKESCGKYNKAGGELHISKNWFMDCESFCRVLLNYLYFYNKKNKWINSYPKEFWIHKLREIQITKKKN